MSIVNELSKSNATIKIADNSKLTIGGDIKNC